MTVEYEILDLRISKIEARLFSGEHLNIEPQLEKLKSKLEQQKSQKQPEEVPKK